MDCAGEVVEHKMLDEPPTFQEERTILDNRKGLWLDIERISLDQEDYLLEEEVNE